MNEILYYEIYDQNSYLFTIVKEEELAKIFCEYNEGYKYKAVEKKQDLKEYNVPDSLEITYLEARDLIFKDIPCICIDSKLPLLINQNNKVVLGNSLKNKCDNKVKCIRIYTEPYMEEVFYGLELAVVEENNQDRFYSLEKELGKFLLDYFNNDECISLFDNEDLKETRTISEVTFIKPPAYNFIKHKKKQQEEEENEINLFSDLL